MLTPHANARSAFRASSSRCGATQPLAMPASKRLLDIVSSAMGLLVLIPLFVLIAIVVRLSSAGPILFTQTRLGQGGDPIKIYKFRSMTWTQCDASGIVQVTKKMTFE